MKHFYIHTFAEFSSCLRMLLGVLLFTSVTYSQTVDFVCGTEDDLEPDSIGVYSYSTDENYLNSFEPKVYNIFFWGVNRSDGSSHRHLIENDALIAVQYLNIAYNRYNIFFKYYGIGHFNSDQYYETSAAQFSSMVTYAQNNGYYHENSFNVYVNRPTNYSGVAVYNTTYLGVGQWSLFQYPDVIIHEIGHNFNLIHTHGSVWPTSNCERVTRDPNDPNFNANIRGDRVVDTNAVPNFQSEQRVYITDALEAANVDSYTIDIVINDGYAWQPWAGWINSVLANAGFGLVEINDIANNGYTRHYYINGTNCTYQIPNPFGVDCDGTPYTITTNDVKNYMAYTTHECRNLFTNGQVIRIREAIDDDMHGMFADAETTLESLYEPYGGEYYYCCGQTHDPLFQPGFDYYFVSCKGDYNIPSDYNDTSFIYYSNNVVAFFDKYEDDFETIIHPNHSAIKIGQLSGATVFQYDNGVRKCYSNLLKAAISGVVIKFNDNVFNNNITVYQKDSIQINNSQLINDLDIGLYKIGKNYNDGTSDESIIFKTSNN